VSAARRNSSARASQPAKPRKTASGAIGIFCRRNSLIAAVIA
jgi:hypothetical protein